MNKPKEKFEYISNNCEKVYSLIKEVNEKGGFYEVVANRLWGIIAKNIGYSK